MDDLWQQAPCPAMRRWPTPQGMRWAINAAAGRWALDRGVLESDWHSLAQQPGTRGRVSLGRGNWPLWRTEVALADGTLWWLATEDPDGPQRATLAELLELAQEFGRMGVFERDLRSGTGHWDPHVLRIFGMDPGGAAPTFDDGMALVHPDDLHVFAPEHRAQMARAGRHAVRFRILRPNGEVRHLHSLSEVRNGPDGKPAKMVGVLIDDTDIVERERHQREESDRLVRALEMAGVSVWRMDAAMTRVFRDPPVASQTSLAAGPDGEPIEQARERIHPDDREATSQAARDAAAGDRVVDVFARYRAGDAWRTLLTRRVAQRDAQGQLLGVLGVALDITDLVAEREQTRLLQERTQALSAALGMGLWSRDVDSGVAEWNEQMYRLYGRAASSGAPSVDEWLSRYVHPMDRERIARDQYTGDEAWMPNYHAEFRIQRPDGAVRWIYCWARRELRDERRVSYGVHLDITERRSAEMELQRERERAGFAMNAAGVGIWELTLEAGVAYWNAQMYRLRGFDPSDPRPVRELARMSNDPGDQSVLDVLMHRHIQHGEPYEHEFRVHWPDGQVRWLATRGRVVRDAEGKALALAGINIDITERRRADELRLEKQRIEQASRAKSEFMARMSHELRTPMNAVLGFTQLLTQDSTQLPTPRQRERLLHIESAGRHLLALIDDVLDLTSIEADDRPLAQEGVDLSDVARDALHWVGSLAQRHNVSLRVDGAALPGRVLSDKRRLGQIAVNLLTNAVKYNRPHGWVQVRSESRTRADGAEEWALIVRDSGRGMSGEQLQRVFEPFNRLGAELEGIPGTGIGLTIVHQLAQRMGGSVQVDSELGVGTEFRVWLPAAQAPPDVQGEAAAAAAAAMQTHEEGLELPALRLLCVEDNTVNMTLVREVVALRPSIALIGAETGNEGLELAWRERPDVILLDLQLPDLHGLEVLKRLRADARSQDATIIALSANAMPDDVRAALAAGFDDYWTKPIDFTRFLEGLDELARRYGASRSRTQASPDLR